MQNALKNISEQGKYYQELGKISSHILHDIINPITGLILYLDMVNEGKDENLKNFLIPIKDTSGTIRDFINYIEKYLNKPNEIQIINVEKMILNTIKLFTPKALKNKVGIYYLKNSSRNLIIGNPLKLFQILINFISNSIDSFENYEPGDKKIINIVSEYIDEQFKILIEDNGCGIDQDNQKNLFKISFSNKIGGSGIGSIHSFNLIKKDFEGKVNWKSQRNVGTIFEIIFPAKRIVHG